MSKDESDKSNSSEEEEEDNSEIEDKSSDGENTDEKNESEDEEEDEEEEEEENEENEKSEGDEDDGSEKGSSNEDSKKSREKNTKKEKSNKEQDIIINKQQQESNELQQNNWIKLMKDIDALQLDVDCLISTFSSETKSKLVQSPQKSQSQQFQNKQTLFDQKNYMQKRNDIYFNQYQSDVDPPCFSYNSYGQYRFQQENHQQNCFKSNSSPFQQSNNPQRTLSPQTTKIQKDLLLNADQSPIAKRN